MPAVILLAGSGMDDRDGFVHRHPDARPAGRRAGRRRLPGGPLRQARIRTERRPLRIRDDQRPRRGRPSGRSLACEPQGRRPESHRAGRPQRRRMGGAAGRVARAADRRRRLDCRARLTGAELVLEQQQHVARPDEPGARGARREDRAAEADSRCGHDRQRAGKACLADVRRAGGHAVVPEPADFDPAKVIKDVRQPLLFVHGELDAGSGRARGAARRTGAQAERLASRWRWSSSAA